MFARYMAAYKNQTDNPVMRNWMDLLNNLWSALVWLRGWLRMIKTETKQTTTTENQRKKIPS